MRLLLLFVQTLLLGVKVEHVGLNKKGNIVHTLRQAVTSLGGDCRLRGYFRTRAVQKRAKYPWSLHTQTASPSSRQIGERDSFNDLESNEKRLQYPQNRD